MDYKKTVLHKLDQIDELFPPERLALSKERWRRLWQGEAPLDRLPFTYTSVKLSYWNITPKEQRLMDHLDEFIARGSMDDDFIPGIFAGCHQGGMASLFGARTFEIYNNNEMDTNCEQLFLTLEDAEKIQPPALLPDSIPVRWINEDQWYIDQTNGRMPLHLVDEFGPVEIAAKLWGYDNLLVAPYLEPDLYSKVMNYATDAFTLFVDEQRKIAGDLLIETSLNAHDWVPTGTSLALGMDSLVMLSPDFFTQYVAPYLDKIADRYAPLTIHSCGWLPQLIKTLCASPNINGIHLGQMPVPELIDAGLNNQVVVIPPGINIDNLPQITSLAETHDLRVNYCIGGLWPKSAPHEWTSQEIEAMKNVHNERVLPLLSPT